MVNNEILELLQKEESDRLEFEEKFNDGVLKTIAAFSNSYGGIVIIGLNKKREIVRIELDDEHFQKIINIVVDSLGITPDFKLLKLNDNKILLIEVKKSSIPISFEGRYFKRVGNTTREMNFDELKRFFQKDLRWERLIENEFTFDEIVPCQEIQQSSIYFILLVLLRV